MCNTSAAAGNVGRGLSISVLFMLAVLAGVVAWLVVAAAKSSRRDTTTGGAPPS
jgi:heme/copper-type cytochrome/quinol oxidase subunit 2